jgi:phage shock protein A
MGLLDWFRKKPPETVDPVKAFEQRIDALCNRASALRKSAATLLTVRRDLDRKLETLGKQIAVAQTNGERAEQSGDSQAAMVLKNDQERFGKEKEHLSDQRAKVIEDAQALTNAVRTIESEVDELKRERDSARVQLATKDVLVRAKPAMEERVDELIKIDRARDEVERAHALAEIYREDAARKRGT